MFIDGVQPQIWQVHEAFPTVAAVVEETSHVDRAFVSIHRTLAGKVGATDIALDGVILFGYAARRS